MRMLQLWSSCGHELETASHLGCIFQSLNIQPLNPPSPQNPRGRKAKMCGDGVQTLSDMGISQDEKLFTFSLGPKVWRLLGSGV